MIVKERASGMYRLSAYFFSRSIGDLALELVLPFLSATLVYWAGGLKRLPGTYIATVLVVLLLVVVAQGLGLLLGALFMEVKKATTLSSILLLSFQLAGGYFMQSTPSWTSWVKYLSFHYYAFKLLLIAQYSNADTYPCDTGTCRVVDYPVVHNVGVHGLGSSLLAMTVMLIGYRFLAYLTLRTLVK